MKHAFFSAVVKSFDDTKLTVTHFISTECKDRSGDIMHADGMELDGWPSVLKQHGQDLNTGSEPIAKCLALKVGTNDAGHKGIIATTQYYNGSGLTPPDNTGQRLYEKAKGEFMPYWSIGFGVKKARPISGGGQEISEWVMYEYSQVGVPDNVEAKDFNPETDEHGEDVSFEIKAVQCVCQACGHKVKSDDKGKCPAKCPKCKGQMSAEGKKEVPAKKSILDPDTVDVLEAPEDIIEHYGLEEVDGMQTVELELGESAVKSVMFYGKAKEFIVAKEDTEAVKSYFAVFPNTGFKGLTERVQRAVPYEAMWTCFDAFMYEIYNLSEVKEAPKLVKEFSALLTVYATQFVEQIIETKDKDAFISECKAIRSVMIKSTPKAVEQAPAKPGDDTPPDDTKSTKAGTVLKLRTEPAAPPTAPSGVPLFKFNAGDVEKAVKDGVKETFDALRGKVK